MSDTIEKILANVERDLAILNNKMPIDQSNWIAARTKHSHLLVHGHTELEGVIEGFARAQILLFRTA